MHASNFFEFLKIFENEFLLKSIFGNFCILVKAKGLTFYAEKVFMGTRNSQFQVIMV